ncbi:hypothetical protein E4U09_003056 [Claviceps aff. purpurea]|uniref:Uncharacterized protein n=2 Tax=Claviceps TaxID=5110 RepID=M1W9E0_CLAP2|nr:hypothetical protein E4U12_001406 [Claviceps purpurea]KAG6293262.1 hypothetical protein E4U09_003056 [Claviceps aff. purpurea]CCE27059.1 uncharacterized protein CPUR_00531 [Claviceps purpurea 20.1]KAG6147107.1 hypothetical protein E4U28_007687 [Claviceps purpurea]KAG6170506.1 hypothetical protein E4U27_007367 [Claviceps purpurea]
MRDTVQDKASWAEHGIHVEPRQERPSPCEASELYWTLDLFKDGAAAAAASGVLPFPGTSLPFRIEFPHRIRKHDDEHDGSRRSCSPMLAGRIGYLRWNERSVSPLGEQGD